MLILLSILSLIVLIVVFGFALNFYLAVSGYKGPISDHFDGKQFYSYGNVLTESSSPKKEKRSIWKWLLNRPKSEWKWRDNTLHPHVADRVMGQELIVTYINHASVLIQTNGLNIITDPVWAQCVSPFSFMGPRRYRPAGISIDELPLVDVILLSHNHYDHMDLVSLRRIVERDHPRIFTGLGNSAYLNANGITGSHDMDWWHETNLKEGMKLTCVPAQHFSARALSDRNKTLWCGFVFETPLGPVYFAGDTGYGPFVQKIAERFSHFRFALLPIGAYVPKFFMSPVHISPSEALQIHQELRVKTSMGIHFGTFRLADDAQDQPPQELSRLLSKAGKAAPDFHILDNGEVLKV